MTQVEQKRSRTHMILDLESEAGKPNSAASRKRVNEAYTTEGDYATMETEERRFTLTYKLSPSQLLSVLSVPHSPRPAQYLKR